MANITLGGAATRTIGTLPQTGSKMPDARLVNTDLDSVSLSDYSGKNLIISIFPSVNTGVCATSVRKFNELAADMENTVVLNVSMDLPFAQQQFCAAEGIDKVEMLSDFRFKEFGQAFNAFIEDGKFAGLHSRAIVVVDTDGNISYNEQVPEIGQEPDYEAALEALK